MFNTETNLDYYPLFKSYIWRLATVHYCNLIVTQLSMLVKLYHYRSGSDYDYSTIVSVYHNHICASNQLTIVNILLNLKFQVANDHLA